jgi:hypothetical protein
MKYFSTIFNFVSSNDEYSIERETLNLDYFKSGPDTITCAKRKKFFNPIHPSGDTLTEIVINLIEKRWKQLYVYRYVSSDKFHIDACIAAWCLINPSEAIKYKSILIEASRIDALREMKLSEDNILIPNSTTDKALKLCCWILETEKTYLWKSYETMPEKFKYTCEKFYYILPRLNTILEAIDSNNIQVDDIYSKIVSDIEFLYTNGNTRIEKWEDIGIVVIFVEKPLHYYALFHPACNMDTVITIYPDNKYEIEDKFTSLIQLTSRKSWPRIPLNALTSVLNTKESKYTWKCSDLNIPSKLTYLIPTLETPISSINEYEGPCNRNILSSDIKSDEFLNLVKSFYTFVKNKSCIKYPKRYWCQDEIIKILTDLEWSVWMDLV